MKAKLDPRLKLARIKHPWANDQDDQNGAFRIRGPQQRILNIVASNGESWEHVSVSVTQDDSTPTWAEMCFVKGLFFEPEEVCMQLHPAASTYVNVHVGTLHIWRPIGVEIPLPRLELV